MTTRLIIIAALSGSVAAFGAWWRGRQGRFSRAAGDAAFTRDELGLTRRDRPAAVLVEFSSDTCAPCAVVEARLHGIAGEIPDVRVVTVDAAERADLTERFGVRRVPTVLVADAALSVVWRASGVPSTEAIRGVLLGPEWAGRPAPARGLRERVRSAR